MINKILVSLIILSLSTFIILIGVGFFSPKNKQATEGAIPTPTVFPSPTSFILPTPNNSKPPISYETDTANKMVDKVKNKVSLSESDALARKKLVNQALQKENSIYSSPLFHVIYIRAFDFFQVEILNQDIPSIKQAATQWFLDQGLSREGVCNLPIMFYLNAAVADSLRGTNTVFSYQPPGC